MPIQTKCSLIRAEQCQPSPFHDVFQTATAFLPLISRFYSKGNGRLGGARSSRVSRLPNQCFLFANVLVHCIPTVTWWAHEDELLQRTAGVTSLPPRNFRTHTQRAETLAQVPRAEEHFHTVLPPGSSALLRAPQGAEQLVTQQHCTEATRCFLGCKLTCPPPTGDSPYCCTLLSMDMPTIPQAKKKKAMWFCPQNNICKSVSSPLFYPTSKTRYRIQILLHSAEREHHHPAPTHCSLLLGP